MDEINELAKTLPGKQIGKITMSKHRDVFIIHFTDESRLEITPGYGHNSSGGETINLWLDDDSLE